jgi:5'-phosphate synthase pdxT subunit
MDVGILAVQGAFAEHEQMLSGLGARTFEIRQARDLRRHMDGLVIPGGESTVQGKLLRELGMFDDIRARIQDGLPVWGTCAGLLLLARRIANDERSWLATMDITAVRNAYGRQLGSFATTADFAGEADVPMVFIRAPYIESVGEQARVLARVDGRIVAARQDNQLVTAFHPELTDDTTVASYFLGMVADAAGRADGRAAAAVQAASA